MKKPFQKILHIFKDTLLSFIKHNATLLSAALSFYTTVSLAPLLVITLAVGGKLFGEKAARGELAIQIEHYMGKAGAEVVQSILANASQPGSGIAAIVSIVFLLISASLVFAQLRNSLNIVWEVETAGVKSGIFRTLLGRLISMGIVLCIGIMLLLSVIAGATVKALQKFAAGMVPQLHYLEPAINLLLGVVLTGFFFALLFKFLPATRLHWKYALLGGLITAGLFNLGRAGISLYLGHSTAASAYGAAGSLLVLLLWIYYSAIIFFFGAELTKSISRDTEKTEE